MSHSEPSGRNTAPKMLSREMVFVLRWQICGMRLILLPRALPSRGDNDDAQFRCFRVTKERATDVPLPARRRAQRLCRNTTLLIRRAFRTRYNPESGTFASVFVAFLRHIKFGRRLWRPPNR